MTDFGAGIGDGEKLHARNGAIFGAMVTAEGAHSDYGGLERPLFRNAAADEHSVPFGFNPGLFKPDRTHRGDS